MPETCAVPQFAPLRVRGGRYGLRRTVRRGRRAMAAGLAMTAAALAASGFREPAAVERPGPADTARTVSVTAQPGPHGPAQGGTPALVSAPVRIADGATVRLLRPGDRVDVIAAPVTAADTSGDDGGPEARVVAAGVRVTDVPRMEPVPVEGGAGGALVVLAVPRATATGLAAAGAVSRLVVTLC
ncbi:RcpC/CpaB family pilus assembly protein [Streptomyces sp. TRM49041]|uniref:RcpC/CpaB family pilus assembly protein n=1 Tax=Streptomyces sp. TRM49041 TaxID=2603216 RepID=UPI001CA46B67|nr:RcpC/CpaB family pilus assembly protein [Streptomyces sp. TRM49041]